MNIRSLPHIHRDEKIFSQDSLISLSSIENQINFIDTNKLGWIFKMPIKKSQDKTFCKYCGAQINQDAQFCKICGKSFNEENSLMDRLNKKIHLLSVIIGLIVAVIVLFVGTSLLGQVIINKVMDVTLYLVLVIVCMLFFGGIVTGITGSKNINQGMINGAVLSLFAFIILGFIIGGYLLVMVGLSSAISSAFGSGSTASTSISGDTILNLIKNFLIIVVCFFAGIGGGALGAWIMEGRR